MAFPQASVENPSRAGYLKAVWPDLFGCVLEEQFRLKFKSDGLNPSRGVQGSHSLAHGNLRCEGQLVSSKRRHGAP